MATTFLLETQNFYFERPFSQETWKGGKQMVIGVVVGHIYYNLREKNFGSRQLVMSWWRHHVKVQASKWRHHAITFCDFCGVFIWAVNIKHTSYHQTRSCSLSFASKIFKIRLELTEICAFFCGDDVTDLRYASSKGEQKLTLWSISALDHDCTNAFLIHDMSHI